MFDGTDPCWIPTVPISFDREWRMHVAQFGDGYQQRMLDGINPLNTRWSLQWENRPTDELLAMDAYLQAEGATSFPFRDPASGILYTVFCDSWHIDYAPSRRKNGQTIYYGTLSAEFYVANGVGIPP